MDQDELLARLNRLTPTQQYMLMVILAIRFNKESPEETQLVVTLASMMGDFYAE